MRIETSDENLKKLSELFTSLQTGEVDGQLVRQPMSVKKIVALVGVSRNRFYDWKDGEAMPQPGNLRAIALDLLKVRELDLLNYFSGKITLRDLLAIRPQVTTPDVVRDVFRALPEQDKAIVLAELLQEMAQRMEN